MDTDGPLLAGLLQTGLYFFPIELFPAAVLLDDKEWSFFDAFVGGEAFAAIQAFAAAAGKVTIPIGAGVHHLVFHVGAVGTFHKGSVFVGHFHVKGKLLAELPNL